MPERAVRAGLEQLRGALHERRIEREQAELREEIEELQGASQEPLTAGDESQGGSDAAWEEGQK
jgi:predicted nuclease with TOPRIM domain